jgi:hypothetical protein
VDGDGDVMERAVRMGVGGHGRMLRPAGRNCERGEYEDGYE